MFSFQVSPPKNGLQSLAHSYGETSKAPGSRNSNNPPGRAPSFGSGQNANHTPLGVPPGRSGTNHNNHQNRPQFGMPPKPPSLLDMPLGTPPGKVPSFGANHNPNRPQNPAPPKPLMSLPSGGPPPPAMAQRCIDCESVVLFDKFSFLKILQHDSITRKFYSHLTYLMKKDIQRVRAICGFEFRGFAICAF